MIVIEFTACIDQYIDDNCYQNLSWKSIEIGRVRPNKRNTVLFSLSQMDTVRKHISKLKPFFTCNLRVMDNLRGILDCIIQFTLFEFMNNGECNKTVTFQQVLFLKFQILNSRQIMRDSFATYVVKDSTSYSPEPYLDDSHSAICSRSSLHVANYDFESQWHVHVSSTSYSKLRSNFTFSYLLTVQTQGAAYVMCNLIHFLWDQETEEHVLLGRNYLMFPINHFCSCSAQ